MRRPGLEWLVFLALGLVGIHRSFQAGYVVGDGVDLFGSVWFAWWIQDCILELRDPGFTTHFFYPLGKDIFAHTGNNFVDMVIAAPLYWLFGNPGYQRWFVLGTFLVNIACFRVLAKGLFEQRVVVFAASLAYAISPYLLFEITAGRITQAFVPFLPLAFHWFFKLSRGGSYRDAALAGLFTALQGWTYWFMGWFMAFAFVPLALGALWRSDDRKGLALRYGLAGLTCGLAILPGVIAMGMAASSGDVPGLHDGPINLFESPGELANNIGPSLHGANLIETVGPRMLLSWSWAPVVLAGLVAAPRLRVACAVVGIMAIGPVMVLPWFQEPLVLPWYMAAYHLLPYFDRLWYPYRAYAVLFLLVCLSLGYLAKFVHSRHPRALVGGMVVFALATLVEQNRWGIYPFVSRDAALPEALEPIRDLGGKVIHLPMEINQDSIMWQTHHEQPMFGGMGENAALLQPDGYRERMDNSFIRALRLTALLPMESQPYSPLQRERIEEEGFRWVVLQRDLVESQSFRQSRMTASPKELERKAIDATRLLVKMLGEPVSVGGAVVLWDLLGEAQAPSGFEPTDEALYTRTWESVIPPEYEAQVRENMR